MKKALLEPRLCCCHSPYQSDCGEVGLAQLAAAEGTPTAAQGKKGRQRPRKGEKKKREGEKTGQCEESYYSSERNSYDAA